MLKRSGGRGRRRFPGLMCAALGVTVACTAGGVNVRATASAQTAVAVEFARAVGSGDYERAHGYLSAGLRSTTPVARLASEYESMVSYGSGPPTTVQAMTAMRTWPDKQPGDVEWVYVAIANDTYSEAVTVVVAEENDRLVIRSIEWGRP